MPKSQLALGFGLGLCAGALVSQVVARSSSSHSATAAAATTTTTVANAAAATTTVAKSLDQGGAPIRGVAVLLIVTGEAETASLVAAFGAERVVALDDNDGGGGGSSVGSLRAMLLRRLARFGTLWRAPGGYAIFSLGGRVGGEAPIAALTELLGGRLLAPLPELVISCGMCGALPPGAPVQAAAAAAKEGIGGDGGGIGDVVVAHPSAVFFERRIAGFGAVSRRQGIGETATWPYSAEVAAEAADDLRAAGCGAAVRTAKVASGRSFGSDPVGLQWLGELGAGAKDMETAPCVSTCELFGVPCAAVRVVVDVVRGDARAEEQAFEAHRAAAVPRLALGACLFARRALQWLQRTEERATLMLRVQGAATAAAAAAAAATTKLLLPRAPRVLVDLGRMIAVHVAMEEEAGPLAAALGLRAQAVPPFAGFGVSCWTGVFGGCPVVLAAHGVEARLGFSRVGTEMATFVTALLCQTFGGRCRAVVNAGTAGATPWSGLAIADVVLASEARFFDGRRVPAAAGAAGSDGGVGEGAAEEQPASVWERTAAVAAGAGLRTAAVGTGSSFDMSPADAAALRSTGAQVKEMEAAAVVWTAAQYGTPCVCVKSITDIVRLGEEGADGGHEEFSQNLYGEAMAALARELPGVVTHVIRELGNDKY